MIVKSLDHLNTISKVISQKLEKGDCIFLIGEIGVGKTTFTRHLINNLQKQKELKETEVLSPTFNLLYEYDIKDFKIMHYDLYRIKKAEELGIKTFGFTGLNDGKMDSLCNVIKVPSHKTEKIQECHIMIGHIICSLIEKEIFNGK